MGSEQLFAAIASDPVRVCTSFTASLIALRDYFLAEKVTTVAMEATGVYWIPVYEVLEEAGLEVCVVNAAHARNLPVRKTDLNDCQWIAELHAKEMLNSGFIPPTLIRELRDYTRLRHDPIEMCSPHILHRQKALDQMNIKLHVVLSDLTEVSGQRLVKAILDGVRAADQLLELGAAQGLKTKRQKRLEALPGRWQESQIFALRQAYENWQHYPQQLGACDQQIALVLGRLAGRGPRIATKWTDQVASAAFSRACRTHILRDGTKFGAKQIPCVGRILPACSRQARRANRQHCRRPQTGGAVLPHAQIWLGLRRAGTGRIQKKYKE